MKAKPVYPCRYHGLDMHPTGCFRMEMTVLNKHEASGAPANSRGFTSALKSIDFERGIAVTLNSIYTFNPEDVTHAQ